jgi:hypothetical protein
MATQAQIEYEQKQLVWAQMLPTWQPVAAIALRADLPVRTALKHLVDFYNSGQVKMSYSRIDGHNKVHMFKKIEVQKILGVYTPIESMVEEV